MDSKMKILIGYDGSDYANYALKDLLKAGLPQEARAVVISIPASLSAAYAGSGNSTQNFVPYSNSEEEVEKAAAMAKRASDLIREQFPAWEVRANVAIGSIERNVAKKVSQWDPDLIVLGLQGCRANGSNYLGGISRRIAEKAKCSVRVARGIGAEPGDPPRVLLCVDDSAYAETAVKAVASRNWPKATEVRILTAVDPFDYTVPEMLDNAIDQAKSFHRLIANELDCIAGFTSSLVKEGEAAKVILKEAEKWKPDCIFLAPRNRNRFYRVLFGGVSGTVVARAQCTVELIRTVWAESPSPSFQCVPATSPAYD